MFEWPALATAEHQLVAHDFTVVDALFFGAGFDLGYPPDRHLDADRFHALDFFLLAFLDDLFRLVMVAVDAH